MTFSDFLAILSTTSLVAIAVALVPTLIRLQRTLHKTEALLTSLNSQSEPLCRSLTCTSDEIRSLATNLNSKMDTLDGAARTAQHAADILLTTSQLLRETTRPVITSLGGALAGISAFSHVLTTIKGKK